MGRLRLKLSEALLALTITALSCGAIVQSGRLTLLAFKTVAFLALFASVVLCASPQPRLRWFSASFAVIFVLHYWLAFHDERGVRGDDEMASFPTNVAYRYLKGEIQWDDGSGPTDVFPSWQRDYYLREIVWLAVSVHLGMLAGFLARSLPKREDTAIKDKT